MLQEVTRRRFMFQTLGVLGGAAVSGDFLPLLAEAAKRKQVLRVAIERDFETLRPELSAGDTANLLRRLIYTTPILWRMQQHPYPTLLYAMLCAAASPATPSQATPQRARTEFAPAHN